MSNDYVIKILTVCSVYRFSHGIRISLVFEIKIVDIFVKFKSKFNYFIFLFTIC